MFAGGRVITGAVPVVGGTAGFPAEPSVGLVVAAIAPVRPAVAVPSVPEVPLPIGAPDDADCVSGEAHAPKLIAVSPTNAKRRSMEPPYPDAQSIPGCSVFLWLMIGKTVLRAES
jgi:hypothetical protein